MRVRKACVFCYALLAALSPATLAREFRRDVPDPSAGYSWREEAKKSGFGQEDVRELETRKVLMTNEAFKQVFTPYIESGIPVFVTSDSILNAFHVLYEESVVRLEGRNARRLPEILRFVWRNLATVDAKLRGGADFVADAKRRAQVVIGTALGLMGDESIGPEGEIGKLIAEETKRVTEAAAKMKPKWLGPPDTGFEWLDYSRYRPRGFYTRSEDLGRYFRAVSWLQSIPFRVARDEELLSILMLGNCVTYSRFRGDYAKRQEYESFFRCFAQFIGAGDDWDIMTAAHEAQNEFTLDLDGNDLAEKREWLLKQAGRHGKGPKINDQVRFAPGDPTKTAGPGFRVISAYRTPDAILFGRTTDLRRFDRPFPDGLEVCAALGSGLAREKLSYADKAKLLATIDEGKALFEGHSLYSAYLHCLSALLDEPERDAPQFMSGEAWRTKSCQTALAGWAQLRHTWALQAKQTAHYLCASRMPTGFVEPEPEFFARMGRLVERTKELLKSAGAIGPDVKSLVADIRSVAEFLEKKGLAEKGMEAMRSMSRDEMMLVERAARLMMAAGGAVGMDDRKKFFAEMPKGLRKLADRIEKQGIPDDPKAKRVLAEGHTDLGPHWTRLGMLCRRLEALAHKQLRGVQFSAEENRFLRGYGVALAGIMLYGGNSYVTPRDDAPRVVDVFYNPNERGGYLEVGVGRSRALYVLYPHKGGEVLCRGAVMPYYEFKHPKRLTDAEWKTLLDSRKRPDVPAWMGAVVGSEGIGRPRLPAEE